MSCTARLHLDLLSSHLDREKKELVRFLLELAEFDRQKVVIELGYPSTLACLVGELALTESSACRRITAARLLIRFPKIADYLVARRLSLTALLALKEILDEDNHAALLERAAGLSEPEVRALVAGMQAPSEELPGLMATPVAAAAEVTSPRESDVAAPTSACASVEKAEIVITLRIGEEFRQELARVRDLASHSVPSGKVEEVLLHVLRTYRKRQERRRFGAKITRDDGARRARSSVPTEGTRYVPAKTSSGLPTRYVPAKVRLEVYDREKGACAYVGSEGKRDPSPCAPSWRGCPSPAPHARTVLRFLLRLLVLPGPPLGGVVVVKVSATLSGRLVGTVFPSTGRAAAEQVAGDRSLDCFCKDIACGCYGGRWRDADRALRRLGRSFYWRCEVHRRRVDGGAAGEHRGVGAKRRGCRGLRVRHRRSKDNSDGRRRRSIKRRVWDDG